jgi:hypothetical protein
MSDTEVHTIHNHVEIIVLLICGRSVGIFRLRAEDHRVSEYILIFYFQKCIYFPQIISFAILEIIMKQGVLTAYSMKSVAFWDVTPCCLIFTDVS